MKEMSKLTAERIHAKRRARERLGINLNRFARRELVKRIMTGKCRCLYRQSHRVSVFRDTINNREIDIVYDKTRHTIITFLSPLPEGLYSKIKHEGKTRKEVDTYVLALKAKAVTNNNSRPTIQGERENNSERPQASP